MGTDGSSKYKLDTPIRSGEIIDRNSKMKWILNELLLQNNSNPHESYSIAKHHSHPDSNPPYLSFQHWYFLRYNHLTHPITLYQ